MQRDETAAVGNEFQERLLLITRDFRVVCEDRERVEAGELGWIQVGQGIGISEINMLGRESGPQLFKEVRRTMVPIITEEKDAKLFRLKMEDVFQDED